MSLSFENDVHAVATCYFSTSSQKKKIAVEKSQDQHLFF